MLLRGVLPELRTLPFADQRRLLDRQIDAGEPLGDLLRALANLRDTEPLCHALRRIAARDLLGRDDVRATLAEVLPTLTDVAVARVLGELRADGWRPGALAPLVEAVAGAVERWPLERIAVLCLADRWLKNVDPETHARLAAEAERAAEQSEGWTERAADGPPAFLLRLSGTRLRALARAPHLRPRLQEFAAHVLDLLEAMPKSLSQANAEEILSRRVYTNAGHFLFELLQNAADAGAARWEVDIDDHEIRIFHDGADFDARDVVGVLSIGQTTKRRDQIGQFGVGFKSVYEVSDRPRIESGLFCFEVADVSMPRRLARPGPSASGGRSGGWGADAREEGTRLVLPLRDPSAPGRTPADIHRHALAVPAETLLTLETLCSLRVSHAGTVRTFTKTADVARGTIALRAEEAGTVDDFAVAAERFVGTRDGRPAPLPVLVAIALDSAGAPRPLGPGPTLFSFLPTRERSGLRFLVHAHFDVPLDRERLDLESSWNRSALAHAGVLLARLVARFAAREPASADVALAGLLSVLPIDTELAHPAHRALLETLCREVRDLPFLPSAAGGRLPPARAALVEEEALLRGLAGVDLTGRGHEALRALPARERKVALELGATPVTLADLADLLDRTLAGRRDGDAPPAPWLAGALAPLLDAFGRAGPEAAHRLRDLPILPDTRGTLHRARSLFRAGPDLRALYRDRRPLLDPALDVTDGGIGAVLAALGVRTLDIEDLLADLADPDGAAALAGTVESARAVLGVLSASPPARVANAGRLPIFPDDRGRAGPLVGPEDDVVWLAPDEALVEFVRRASNRRLRLIHPLIAADATPLLRRLGARTLDLEALVAALARGALTVETDLYALHGLLEARRAELSPRLCRALRATPLFPDESGRARPLEGSDRAHLPGDEDVQALLPELPWIAPAIGGLAYVRELGVEAVGALTIARAVLLEGDLVVDVTASEDLRRVVGYLGRHGRALPVPVVAELARAPLWLDRAGNPHALAATRRAAPEAPRTGALYEAWAAFPLLEEGPGSALELVRTLRLEAECRLAEPASLIHDLCTGPVPDASSRALLIDALHEVASRVAPSTFRALRAAPIFLDEQGVARPLAAWADARGDACHRVSDELREVLRFGARPLLAAGDERDFGGILDRMELAVCGALDLVREVEADPSFARPQAAAAVRRALLAHRSALVGALAADPHLSARLSALPLWPTTGGLMLGSSSIHRGAEMEALLGDLWRATGEGELVLLDPAAEAEAQALSDLFSFRSGVDLLVTRVERDARPGQPLSEQTPLLSSREHLVRVARAIASDARGAARLGQLPVALDALGRLCQPRLLAATPEEVALARGTSVLPRLADPAWSRELEPVAPRLLPRLSARALLLALAETAREPVALAEHPLFSSEPSRAALFSWLLARAEEIEADPEALGILGRAALLPTEAGVLRAPRDLVLAAGVPDLGLGWGVSSEVPAPLVAWLRRVYRLDETKLRDLVERVLEGHDRAVAERDGARSLELLSFLARALGSQGDLGALATRFRLSKRLRVEARSGEFLRPKELLAPHESDRALLDRFLAAPPAAPASRLGDDPLVVALLEAAGMARHCDAGQLRSLLAGEGLRSEPSAAVALAIYVAERALETRALRQELGLDRAAWVPAADGHLARPGELFWPDEAVVAILGHDAARLPDPEVAHRVRPATAAWLGFRTSEAIGLAEVVRSLEGTSAADPSVLAFLEDGLAAGRLGRGEIAGALRPVKFLQDDDGRLRAPAELVRTGGTDLFGTRRGTFAAARRWPRLAAALKISPTPETRDVVAFLQEVARDLEAQSPAELAAAEPFLFEALPRCLHRLAASGAPVPRPLPLSSRDPRGAPQLAVWPADSVVLPAPDSLLGEAERLDLPILLATLPGYGAEETAAWLFSAGVPDLWSLWEQASVRTDPLDRPIVATDLEERLRDLWPALALPGAGPPEVGVVLRIDLEGRLGGRAVVLPAEAAFEGTSVGGGPSRSAPSAFRPTRLLLTPEAVADPTPIVELLCRTARRWPGPEGATARLIVDVLSAETRTERERRLAREPSLEPPPVEAPPPAPPSAPRRDPRAPPSPPTSPAPTEAPREGGERPGLLRRMARWLRDEPAIRPPAPAPRPPGRDPSSPVAGRPASSARSGTEAPRPGSPAATRGGDDARWFSPSTRVGPQLRGAGGWLADRSRPGAFGLAHAPRSLPFPWTYAPRVVAESFDESRQTWRSSAIDPEWLAPLALSRGVVRMRGRIPKGEVALPVPLFGRIESAASSPEGRMLPADPLALWLSPEDADLRLDIVLHEPPRFDEVRASPTPPAALLEPHVPDSELPEETLRFVEEVLEASQSPFERTLEVRAFVRRSYRYDPSYLEDPAVARWLARIADGRPSTHLAALHAGRDGQCLGRGVCYELNVLTCELLRRVGVGAAIATGWVLDRGSLDEPDHLWALALLPTTEGFRFLSVDASTTQRGQALRVPHRPPGPWRAPPLPRAKTIQATPKWLSMEATARQRPSRRLPTADLLRVARYVEIVTGERLGSESELRDRCRALLADPEHAKHLLALLRET